MLSPSSHKSVLLIDDHPIVVAGLTTLVESTGGYVVIGSVPSATEAVACLGRIAVDVILIEIATDNGTGLDSIASLRTRAPAAKILCVSKFEESFYAERALRAGAMGYVMKAAEPGAIVDALKTVAGGQVFLSTRMSSAILGRLAGNTSGQPLGTIVSTLSNRELQVVQLIGESRDNRTIAELLHLSVKTVEAHRSRIRDKLSIRSANELVRFATQWVEQNVG